MPTSEHIAALKTAPRTHSLTAFAAAVTAWGIGWPVKRGQPLLFTSTG